MKKPLILICNSHIDPVWLWEWEEGLAETLSTFRTAVIFCEEYEDLVFCHNESLLYEWVEEHDPSLFQRIRKQVKEGRWHIMGGWYLQPDCNLVLGESVARQIITGKKYFLEKFGKEPHTAINFDSFGHSRGLVQILAAAGYDSYLFCRPDYKYLDLPGDTFHWLGFDGSRILAHRASDHYNSQFGMAGEKLKNWLNDTANSEKEVGVLLWGIGNHGGGPSEKDIRDIKNIRSEENKWDIIHGTPEQYFSECQKKPDLFPNFKSDLNPFAVGCYTSMKTLKQALYRLEHKYYTAEKLLAIGSMLYGSDFPEDKLEEALKEILFCQFHDILPGSSVEAVEKNALNRIGHAVRIIENEKASLFIKAGNALHSAVPGEFPVMLLNPHPFAVEEIFEMELQLPEPNSDKTKRRIPFVYNEAGESVPVQSEKPSCNIIEDHRKKVVFKAKIPAGEIRRYSCFLRDLPLAETSVPVKKELIFSTGRSKLSIDRKSGFPKSWEFNSDQFFGKRPFRFAVIEDSADPWGMGIKTFNGNADFFRLMNKNQASEFAGLPGKKIDPVYISESGGVRTVVESLFTCNNSRIHLRYFIPADLSSFDIEITVCWMEKDKLLKWIIPVGYKMNCVCRSLSGINCFKNRNQELVFRDWIGMKAFYLEDMFSICSEGAYGFDIHGNNVGISLLRSPSYSGHPVEGEDDIVMSDRAVKRIDQGVHTFRFRFVPGKKDEIMDRSFNHSDLFNNPVISRLVYPTGKETKRYSGIIVSNDSINLQAVKMHSEDSIAIRLLNPCKEMRKFTVEVPAMEAVAEAEMKPKAIATFVVKKGSKQFEEVDLLERSMKFQF